MSGGTLNLTDSQQGTGMDNLYILAIPYKEITAAF